MKLKKKTLFECSIAIPAIQNDKEGLLVGGFSGISVIDVVPVENGGCNNAPCLNDGCVNYGCSNGPCDNGGCVNASAETTTPTPTPTSTGAVSCGFLFGF